MFYNKKPPTSPNIFSIKIGDTSEDKISVANGLSMFGSAAGLVYGLATKQRWWAVLLYMLGGSISGKGIGYVIESGRRKKVYDSHEQAGIDLANSLAEADRCNEERKSKYDTARYAAMTITPLDLPDGTYQGNLLGYGLSVQGLTATTDVGLRNVTPKPFMVDVIDRVGYLRNLKY